MTPTSRQRQPTSRGYSLVEVMAVVVIVGILATIATVGVRRYILSTKTAEAIHMIGAIKAAQEAWRDETFSYLDVSVDINAVYPQGASTSVGTTKFRWGGSSGDVAATVAANWALLNVSTSQYVYYGYSCVAGGAGGGLPDVGTSQADPFGGINPTEPWYVVRAIGDLDGDGTNSFFVSSSFMSEIYSEQPEE